MADSATATKTDSDAHGHEDDHSHHVVPVKVLVGTIATLMFLTVVTVLAAKVDLGGSMNIIVAMAIAGVKASLVCAIFMHLWWDQKINAFILFFSIFLLILFLSMAALDTGQYQDQMIPDYAEKKMKNALNQEEMKLEAKGQTAGQPAGGGEQAGGAPAVDPARAEKLQGRAKRLFSGALPAQASWDGNPITEAKVTLGRMLYYDARLSRNGTISCNSCHQLDAFGVDGEPTSPGWDGTRGERNSPTVFNAAFQFRQFWDGREPNVEAQSKGPLTNPIEHGLATWTEAEQIIAAVPEYAPLFEAAFPGASPAITIDNMAKAIGAFERQLVTPAPFDAFLGGDLTALSAAQLDGLDAFTTVGCTDCHTGPLLGGTMYQKLGLYWPWETSDTGRMQVTGSEADKFMFKVPQLRNVTETGPYLHDGSVTDLAEMVRLMARHQIRNTADPDAQVELSEKQVADIVTFLGSLKGEVDEAYVARPALPGQ